ncbi:hypothetical protein B0A49_13266, partial [Cryomyces minteri]
MLAHAAIGKLFNIPTILTTSAQQGPNGPLPKEILEMYPDAPLVKRQGEVDAWDNADFRAAVRATNKTQVVMAGIVTDVCNGFLLHEAPPLPQQHRQTLTLGQGTTFLALSLRAEGYSVWANVEASGTTTALIRDVSNSRMQAAGVQLVSLFSIVCDLIHPAASPATLPRSSRSSMIILMAPIRYASSTELSKFKIPHDGAPADVVHQLLKDELDLDGRPNLNLA